MQKSIISWTVGFVAVLALSINAGCGGEAYEDEASDEPAELGELEQAITGASANSGSRSYGVSTISTRNSCSSTIEGQSCLVPAADKTFTYRITNGTGVSGCTWTNGQRSLIQTAMGNLASSTTWSITQVAGTPTLEFVCRSGIGLGSTSTQLSAYRSWTPNGNQLTTLTDTAAGTWQRFIESSCLIDMPDISARAAVTPPFFGLDTELLMHAASNCGLLAEGVGTRGNVAGQRSAADRSVHDSNTVVGIDFQSGCLANSRVQGNATQFSFAGTCNQ